MNPNDYHEVSADSRLISSVVIDGVTNAHMCAIGGLIDPKARDVGKLCKRIIDVAVGCAQKQLESRRKHHQKLTPELEAYAIAVQSLHARLCDVEGET